MPFIPDPESLLAHLRTAIDAGTRWVLVTDTREGHRAQQAIAKALAAEWKRIGVNPLAILTVGACHFAHAKASLSVLTVPLGCLPLDTLSGHLVRHGLEPLDDDHPPLVLLPACHASSLRHWLDVFLQKGEVSHALHHA